MNFNKKAKLQFNDDDDDDDDDDEIDDREKQHKKQSNLIDKKDLEATNYYFKNGLRRVVPYFFQYKTFVKQRWWNKPLLDVLLKEFRAYSSDYYKNAIEKHSIRLFNQKGIEILPCTTHTVLQNGWMILHDSHRHEVPVCDDEIKIIHENKETGLIVVSKPSSIPVHPTGRFNHNSVVYILAKEKQINDLHIIHRIDRLTSGLLIMTRNSATASIFSNLIRSGNVDKTYLAKVRGKFPYDASFCCDAPIKTTVHALGINEVHSEGKPSVTYFKLLHYDPISDESIVECKPKTGRTHQIRVHLKHLGYPIANDPLYLTDELQRDVGVNKKFEDVKNRAGKLTKNREYELNSNSYSDVCDDCKIDWENILPKEEDLVLYLHAYKYSFFLSAQSNNNNTGSNNNNNNDDEKEKEKEKEKESKERLDFIAPPPAWAKDAFPETTITEDNK